MSVAPKIKELLEVDRVVHAPPRLVLLAILAAVDQADFLFLERETGLTRGNLSSHLTKLEDAGFIAIDKTYLGKRPATLCRLTESGSAALRAHLTTLRETLDILCPDTLLRRKHEALAARGESRLSVSHGQ